MAAPANNTIRDLRGITPYADDAWPAGTVGPRGEDHGPGPALLGPESPIPAGAEAMQFRQRSAG